MLITIQLDDDLAARAAREAAKRGMTLSAFIEEALREHSPASPGWRAALTLTAFRGDGLRPGLDLDDTGSLLDLMDEPRPVC